MPHDIKYTNEEMMVQPFRIAITNRTLLALASLVIASAAGAPGAKSQTAAYTCFPTCSTTDGRFLSLAGSGTDAFAGNDITIGIGLPPNAAQLHVGIFDAESGGQWDKGTAPLEYRLFADARGDGTEATLLATWKGTDPAMRDNDWFTIERSIDSIARAASGNLVYCLTVSMPPPSTGSTGSFKLRTNGTITVRSHQSFSIQAPLFTVADARVIYPNWDLFPSLDAQRYAGSTYDGTWSIYLDMPLPSTSLTVWDGEMDHGSFDGSSRDTDDEDTPSEKPVWATANASNESAAAATPFDDNASMINRRSPAVRYDLTFPDSTTTLSNENPSGTLEWEQFKLSTEDFDRSKMDAHVDDIPAGIYMIRLVGMDLLNVNAWRFFNNVVAQSDVSNVEVIGVDDEGRPVAPLRAIEAVDGSVSGTVFYDSDSNGTQGVGEPGIPSVTVTCSRLDANGQVLTSQSALTNEAGNYGFSKLGAGAYRIEVQTSSLLADVVATADADGQSSANIATGIVAANTPNVALTFGYRSRSTVATGTRGYWTNHVESWPLSQIKLGATWYSKADLLGILQRPTRGDKSYSMAAQLIAAKLNLARGSAASCIGEDVVRADEWLALHPLDMGKTSDEVWSTGSAVHQRLDDYNNGRLCAPHMN